MSLSYSKRGSSFLPNIHLCQLSCKESTDTNSQQFYRITLNDTDTFPLLKPHTSRPTFRLKINHIPDHFRVNLFKQLIKYWAEILDFEAWITVRHSIQSSFLYSSCSSTSLLSVCQVHSELDDETLFPGTVFLTFHPLRFTHLFPHDW